jgi:hypothetical protein
MEPGLERHVGEGGSVRVPMSLRDDFRVFGEPGFYVSAILTSLLIGGLLVFCGLMVHRVQL